MAESSAIVGHLCRSCRCAVIVDPDNIGVEGTGRYPGPGQQPVKAAATIFMTRGGFMTFASRLAAAALAAALCWPVAASAQQPAPQPPRVQAAPDSFGVDELVGTGH